MAQELDYINDPIPPPQSAGEGGKPKAQGEQAPLVEPSATFPTDETRGGTVSQRYVYGLIPDTAGDVKLRYLEHLFGAGNVRQTGMGGAPSTIEVTDPRSQKKYRFDPAINPFKDPVAFVKEIPGDLADIFGDAYEFAVGTAFTGLSAGSGEALGGPPGAVLMGITGAMVAGGAGRSIRRAASEAELALSGFSSGTTPTDIVGDVSNAAMEAGLGETTGYALGKIASALRPSNFFRRWINRNVNPDYVDEGRALEESTGVELSHGQLTGSGESLGTQNALAQRPGGAPVVAELRERQAGQVGAYVEGMVGRQGGRATDEDAGKAVYKAYTDHIERLRSRRTSATKPMFERAEALAMGQRLMKADSLIETIRRLKKESVGKTDVEAYLSQLEQKVLGLDELRLTPDEFAKLPQKQRNAAKAMTPTRFLNLMSTASSGAHAPATVDSRLVGDPARRMFAELHTAMGRDMDSTISALIKDKRYQNVAPLLKQARSHYKILSAPLNRMRDAKISKLLDAATEGKVDLIAKDLVSMRSDVYVRDLMLELQKFSPEAASTVRAAALTRMIEKAPYKSAQPLADEAGKLNFVNLDTVLNGQNSAKTRARMAALFAGEPAALQDLSELGRVLKRLTMTAGGTKVGGSPTEPLKQYNVIPDAIAASLNPVAIAKAAAMGIPATMGAVAGKISEAVARLFVAEQMAKALTTREGRKSMLQVMDFTLDGQLRLNALVRLGVMGADPGIRARETFRNSRQEQQPAAQ